MSETWLETKARMDAEGARRDDGYLRGSDPFQGITNPDAWTGVNTTDRPTWENNQTLRTFAADSGYGKYYVPDFSSPGAFDLPTTTPGSNNRGGGGGLAAKWREEDRAWEIATRQWEKEQWERDALWRAEDREWREEDRAEQERKRQERIASLDAYDEAMRGIYTPERVNAIYDPLVQTVNTNADNSLARLGGITDAMTQRGTQARGAVADAFNAGDQRLQNMRGDFRQQTRNTDAGFGSVLSNMGVQGGVEQGGGYMDRMFANARTGNARAATIFDASAADRGALVGGLQGDVSSGMTGRRNEMLGRIATDRAAAQRESETSLANTLAQSGIARSQV